MDIASPKHLLNNYIAYIIIYFIGSLIYGFIKEENENSVVERLFKKSVIGMLVCITVFSIIKTHFFTINNSLVLLVLFWLISNKNIIRKKFNPSFNIIDIVLPLVLLTIFYGLTFFLLYDVKSNRLFYYPIDVPVYATLVKRLCISNIETTINTLYSNKPIRELYHYGDLWLYAFYTATLKVKPAIAISLIAPVQLLTILVLGSIGFVQRITQTAKLTTFHIIAGFSIVFLSGISFYIPNYIPYFNARWQEDYILFTNTKYILTGIFLIWIYILICNKSYKNISYVIAASVPIYFVSMPALLAAYGFFMLFLLFKRIITIKQAVIYAIPLLIMAGYFISYVLYTHHINDIYLQHVTKPAIPAAFDIGSFGFYKFMISTFVDTSIRVTISILFYILILGFFIKKLIKDETLQSLVFMAVTLVYSSVLAFGILGFLSYDSYQFWLSISVTAVPLLSLIVLSLLYNTKRLVYRSIIWVVIGTCFCVAIFKLEILNKTVYAYNPSIASLITKEIKNVDNTSIVFLAPTRDSTEIWSTDRNFYVPFDFLCFYTDNYQPVCLSVFDIDFNETNKNIKKAQISSLYSSVFYRFVEEQKYDKTFTSIEQSQLDFIKEYDIKFLIIQNNATVSEPLKAHIKKSVYDAKSKNRFCYIQ